MNPRLPASLRLTAGAGREAHLPSGAASYLGVHLRPRVVGLARAARLDHAPWLITAMPPEQPLRDVRPARSIAIRFPACTTVG